MSNDHVLSSCNVVILSFTQMLYNYRQKALSVALAVAAAPPVSVESAADSDDSCTNNH